MTYAVWVERSTCAQATPFCAINAVWIDFTQLPHSAPGTAKE